MATADPRNVQELPPRARRIQPLKVNDFLLLGTTSACAENTLKTRTERVPLGNYLRVRGEYEISEGLFAHVAELPPRARRILPKGISRQAGYGTTSACAENTSWVRRFCSSARNYLRVRGEYSLHTPLMLAVLELPPRARRIHVGCAGELNDFGTTSACAENTFEQG